MIIHALLFVWSSILLKGVWIITKYPNTMPATRSVEGCHESRGESIFFTAECVLRVGETEVVA